MPELTEKQTKDLEKKREKAADVQEALDGDIPYEINDAMETLSDKGLVKDLKACLKRGGVDGTIFLGALSGVLAEWKAFNKVMDAAMKDASKEVARINKLIGEPE